MSMELIQRLASGYINQVNDSLAGGGGGNIGPQVGLAPGQLGKILELDDSELIFNSAVGTVYGGGFRYVQLASTATANPAVGTLVFWNPIATSVDSAFVVTTLESITTPGAQYAAGIVLSSTWGLGNYLTGTVDTTGMSPATASNFPANTVCTIGEVFNFYNTFDWLCRISDSDQIGYGFSGFVPAQNNTRVVGQITWMQNWECLSPRTQKSFLGVGG